MSVNLPYRELAAYRRALRAFGDFSERTCRASGISALEYQVLLAVAAAWPKGATRSALSHELAMPTRAAARLFDRLHEASLIRVQDDPDDRRHKRCVLTANGEHLLVRLGTRHLGEIRRTAAPLRSLLAQLTGDDVADGIDSTCARTSPASMHGSDRESIGPAANHERASDAA
jgi:DNA-binding MarR family transcriptional regulator